MCLFFFVASLSKINLLKGTFNLHFAYRTIWQFVKALVLFTFYTQCCKPKQAETMRRKIQTNKCQLLCILLYLSHGRIYTPTLVPFQILEVSAVCRDARWCGRCGKDHMQKAFWKMLGWQRDLRVCMRIPPSTPTWVETPPDAYLIRKLSFLCIYHGCLWAKNKQVSVRPRVTGALVEATEESEVVVEELNKYPIWRNYSGGFVRGHDTREDVSHDANKFKTMT